mgnify:CR=1 FL=1
MRILSFIYKLLFNRNSSKKNNTNHELFQSDEYLRPNHENYKDCPRCKVQAKTNKEVIDKFGLMEINGNTYIQSWCRNCRKNKDNVELSKIDQQQEIELNL